MKIDQDAFVWIQDISDQQELLECTDEIVSNAYRKFLREPGDVPLAQCRPNVTLAAFAIGENRTRNECPFATVSLNLGSKKNARLELMEFFKPTQGDWSTYSEHGFNAEKVIEVIRLAYCEAISDQTERSRLMRLEIARRFFNSSALIGQAYGCNQVWAIASLPVVRLVKEASKMPLARAREVKTNDQHPIVQSYRNFWEKLRPALFRAYSRPVYVEGETVKATVGNNP